MKPIVGISLCLMGERVRYDGGHCKNPWIVEELSKFVELKSVCPEFSMGLLTPRPPMHLQKDLKTSSIELLVTENPETNYTILAQKTSLRLINDLSDMDGHIFKKSSPSCGLKNVMLFSEGVEEPVGVTQGLYAQEVERQFPNIACVEEVDLNTDLGRETFLIHLFLHHRFKRAASSGVDELLRFHKFYSFLLFTHSPKEFNKLNKFMDEIKDGWTLAAVENYYSGLAHAIKNCSPEKQKLEHISPKDIENHLLKSISGGELTLNEVYSEVATSLNANFANYDGLYPLELKV